jgi:putative transposase
LDAFEIKWNDQYLQIAKSWRANWVRVIPFFAYAPEIRNVIYTTNAIESVNFSLRKLSKMRGAFPTDDAAIKLLYLGLHHIGKRWTMPIQNWKQAMSQLMIRFNKKIQETQDLGHPRSSRSAFREPRGAAHLASASFSAAS